MGVMVAGWGTLGWVAVLENYKHMLKRKHTLLQIHFQVMVYTCTESERDHVLHVSCVSRVSPETGGEQNLVVWSWSDACVIA